MGSLIAVLGLKKLKLYRPQMISPPISNNTMASLITSLEAEIGQMEDTLVSMKANLAALKIAFAPAKDTFKLILPSGESICPKKTTGNHISVLRCPASQGQVFKEVKITSGPHTGYMEFVAVGGIADGKLLDNYRGKCEKICFYGRLPDRKDNKNQRWKITDGKISSFNSGVQLKALSHPFLGISLTNEGDAFTLSYE
jgi:hypothetical protein